MNMWYAVELIESAAEELKTVIDDLNKIKESEICNTDLDEPDYHDYQTCHELILLGRKLKDFLNDAS